LNYGRQAKHPLDSDVGNDDDDCGDSEITQYLGVVKETLISLANDKHIKETFELKK